MKHLDTARRDKPISLLCGILGIVSVLIIIFFGHENRSSLPTVLKLSLLSIVLLSVIIFYVSSQYGKIYELPHFYAIFSLIYLGSLFLILLTKDRAELTLWMTGGLLTAMLFNMYLGYIVTFDFVFFASFAGGFQLEFIVYLFILGTFMCLLSGYMKKYSTLGYTAVIILSIQLILIFIINNFILKNSLNIAAVRSLASTLLSIGFSYGIYTVYTKKTGRAPEEQALPAKGIGTEVLRSLSGELSDTGIIPEMDVAEAGVTETDVMEADVTGTDVDRCDTPEEKESRNLEEILDTEFPLLKRLEQYSQKVYRHSLLISDLSGKAAKAVGADEYKAKAGGLYHEIGRIENKEYVEEGIKLARAYHLPGVITDMIRQHNIKYEKPKSPEAAIVMITISIIATKEYLEKTESRAEESRQPGMRVPIEKIVDNVFQMRFSRGSLDESGLTLKQYHDLKEFFLHI